MTFTQRTWSWPTKWNQVEKLGKLELKKSMFKAYSIPFSLMQACSYIWKNVELFERRIRSGTCLRREARRSIEDSWTKDLLYNKSPKTGEFFLSIFNRNGATWSLYIIRFINVPPFKEKNPIYVIKTIMILW